MTIKAQSKKKWFLSGLIILSAIIVLIVLNAKQSPTILINLEKVKVISKDNITHIRKLGVLKPLELISFAQQGTVFVTASDGEISVGDYSTGKSILSLDNVSPIRCLAISPDGNEFAIGHETDISLWNITGKKEAVLVGHMSYVTSLAFSPDGKLLASTGYDNTVRIWDLTTKQSLSILEGHTRWINGVAFSPDGQQLASIGHDKTVRIWDVASKREIKTLNVNQSQPNDLTYSPLGDLLAVAYDDNAIQLWSIAEGKIINEFKGSPHNEHIALTPDGLIMASSSWQTRSESAKLRFWNAVTGDLLLEIPFPKALGLPPMEFTPDGKILAFGGEFWGVPLLDS